jgi:4-hydroxy-tetrahydrodipicolinate synthase
MSDTTNTPLFGRVVTAMVTPMDQDGEVDYAAAARLAQYLVENGSDGLVVTGTTGESPTLTEAEKLGLYRAVREAVGDRAKIIAGTGSYNTEETIHLSIEAERAGVDALLLVAPYYNKPSQEGIYRHFQAVAERVGIPIMLYNIPPRSVVNIDMDTMLRLAEIPNIVAVKEASKNLDQMSEVISKAPAGFQTYSGDDSLTLPILSIGGVGVVSVTSHVAGLDLRKLHDAFFAGDFAGAREIHLRRIQLTKALFCTSNPTPTKAALEMLGVLSSSRARLPIIEANETERAMIRKALQDYGALSE